MIKRTLLTAFVALAVLGAIFGYKFFMIGKMKAAMAARPIPATAVSTMVAQEEVWPDTLQAVGSLTSSRGIAIKTELEGLVRRIAFTSGAAVAAGAPIVDLDDSVEVASLAGLEARVKLTDANLVRARELRASSTNTPYELDVAEADASQAHAAVAQMRATIAKKHILAPFAGRLGIERIHPGQFLSKGDAIVQLETLDPIHLDFSLPQQDIAQVALGQKARFLVDAFPGRTFEGAVTAIEPRLNETTRSVTLRATLANAGEVLRPGMFGQVEVVLPHAPRVIGLPTAAIVYNPYGNVVFVIENGIAKQRFVETGAQRGSRVAVLSGLKPGETVVTSGQIKLRNGSPVQVNNAVTPSANPAPKPAEG